MRSIFFFPFSLFHQIDLPRKIAGLTYIIVILARANNYGDLFATRRRQTRGRCRCRTAAAGSAQGAMRLDVEEGAIGGGGWRGDDFRFRGTRASPLAAVGCRVPRQRLQGYPIDPYRLPIALTVCERNIYPVGERIREYVR